MIILQFASFNSLSSLQTKHTFHTLKHFAASSYTPAALLTFLYHSNMSTVEIINTVGEVVITIVGLIVSAACAINVVNAAKRRRAQKAKQRTSPRTQVTKAKPSENKDELQEVEVESSDNLV